MVPFLTVYKGKCKTTSLSCWQPFRGHEETLLQAKENLVGGEDQSRVLGVTLTRTTAPMTVPLYSVTKHGWVFLSPQPYILHLKSVLALGWPVQAEDWE